LRERPLKDFFAVAAGADGAAVLADEGFEGGGGVHVGDGDEGEAGGGAAGFVDDVPGVFDIFELGHVGHGAAGAHVGKEDVLVVAGEDVGGFGHEVDAAEDDVLGLGELGGFAGELEGVADDVGEADDIILLVVVAEDDEAVAKLGFAGGDAVDEVALGELGVGVGDGLLPVHGCSFRRVIIAEAAIGVDKRRVLWEPPTDPGKLLVKTVLRA
jgi:hypothetical protein